MKLKTSLSSSKVVAPPLPYSDVFVPDDLQGHAYKRLNFKRHKTLRMKDNYISLAAVIVC